MILYERGLLDLEAPVTAIVPEFAAGDCLARAAKSRCACCSRTAPACLPTKSSSCAPRLAKHLLQAAFATPLAAAPGTRAEYSDIGFIILGVALERLADESLDAFCQREIFGPLGMTHTTFNPAPALAGYHPADRRRSHLPPPHHSRRGAGRKRQRARRRCRTCRPVLDRRRSSHLRPRHAQRRTSDPSLSRPSNFFRGGNPRPTALLARWAGTRRSAHRNRENIFRPVRLDISVTPAHRCGSTRSASFR